MFDDFDGRDKDEAKGRGRMGLSLALSALVYVGLAALLATAVATAHAVVREREREVDVEFASLPPAPPAPEPEVAPPPPPPPPPRPRTQRTNRPAARRDSMAAPDAIPDARPEESDGNLVEAGATGPVDGFTDGGGEAPEPPRPAPPAPPPPPPPRVEPRQERMEVRRPELLSGCRSPEVPPAVQRQAATIRILVQMLILPDGRPSSVRVIEGHPLIPDDVILACARDQVFAPARLPDGTAVPYPFRRRFVFRPSNL
jgi:protein TonB